MAKGGGGGGGGRRGGGGRAVRAFGVGGSPSAADVGGVDTVVGTIEQGAPINPGGVQVGPGSLVEDLPKEYQDAITAYSGGKVDGGERFQGINAEKLNRSLYAPGSVYGKPQEYLDRLTNYKNELNESLSKVKNYVGQTYRIVRDNDVVGGLAEGRQGLAAKYTPGKVAHFNEFISTSARPDSLFNYNAARNQVRFKVNGKTGKYIDPISAYKESEYEVLFGSGKNFMINSKKWNKKNSTWDIEMTEI